MFALGFIVGAVVGVCIGVVVMALCAANGRDRWDE